MSEAPYAGNAALPGGPHEPVASWSKLSSGDSIAVYRGQEFITSGRIDMLAEDGSILWIIQDQGRGRWLFLNEDGFDVVKRQAA